MQDTRISSHGLVRLLGAWRGSGPSYRDLAETLRLAALDGRLPLGTRLPGERDLAATLGMSRTTVAASYAHLREAGYLESRRGSGSSTTLPDHACAPGSPLLPGTGSQLDLAHASLPAPEVNLHAAVTRASEQLARHLPGHGYDTLGMPGLRAAVADHYTRRGLPTRAEEILVTNGAQHAFALALRLLAGPGDRVLVEHPTYPNALEAIRGASARPVPVPFPPAETGGWDTEMLAATLRQAAPRLAYLVVDFHNPTGRCMDAATRERVAGLLARTHTPVVVDETLVDLWLDGDAPPPPLAAFDRAGVVLATGTASKAFWGGLRVGWIRAPRELIQRLATARVSVDLGTPVLEQLVVAELLAEGDAVLGPRRAGLATRRDALAKLVRDSLPGWRFESPGGGLALWCQLDAAVSSALAAVADRHGVRVAAGPRFGVDGAFERHLRLPYTLPEAQLTDAVERLRAAYTAVMNDANIGPLSTDAAPVL